MATRKIIVQGDERLEKKCHPITDFNQRIHDLMDDQGYPDP